MRSRQGRWRRLGGWRWRQGLISVLFVMHLLTVVQVVEVVVVVVQQVVGPRREQ